MKIALYQMSSGLDYKINLDKVRAACTEALKAGAEVLFLPECFFSLSDGKNPTPHVVSFENEHFKEIQSLAKDHSIHLVAGSVSFLENEKVYNRSLCFSDSGELIDYYDKRKLFSCDFQTSKGRKIVDEHLLFTPGNQEKLISVKELKLGMGTCFDIRFSEFSASYRKAGANCLIFPSAFTRKSGEAHWETLNRARAIENQCFVISAAQTGENHPSVRTYGHSLVISPWGDILLDAGEDEGLHILDLNLSELSQIRAQIHMK